MQHVQFIGCIAERDIDLLLLEELHVSAAFRNWLVTQAFGPDVCCHKFLGAWHSISDSSLGESDLVLLFEDIQGSKTALLIENKIDAPPQPDQAARYHMRGKAGIENGSWTKYRTCMTAPYAYLIGTSDAARYEVRLSYESVRDWFQQFALTDERSAWRGRIIQEGIEQNRRGYQPTPHAGVTQFWFAYWQLACAEFPQLRLKQPGQIPARHDWARFDDLDLGAGRRLLHKLSTGVVDLEIRSAGDLAEEIAARNRELLEDGLEIVRTGKSASVRGIVPTVDRFGDVSTQMAAVRAGLSTVARLLELSSRIKAD